MIRISKIDDKLSIYKENIVVAMGIGHGVKIMLNLLKNQGINIEYICDIKKENWGEIFEDIPVISPKHLQLISKQENKNIVVQIATYKTNTQTDELLSTIEESDIISFSEAHKILNLIRCINLDKQGKLKPNDMIYKYKEPNLNETPLKNYVYSINDTKEKLPVIITSFPKTGYHTLIETFEKNNIDYHCTWHRSDTFDINSLVFDKIKIITAVREPIAQNISMMYQDISTPKLYDNTLKVMKNIIKNNNINEIFENGGDVQLFFDNLTTTEIGNGIYNCLSTFMNKFKKNILDLSKYPFDKEKGYSIIKEGNIEVFVYQLEKLNDIAKDMSDWIGQTSFDKWVNANEASSKWIAESYNKAKKEIKFSQEYFDNCYNNPWVQHFYSQEDIEKFKVRWSSNIKPKLSIFNNLDNNKLSVFIWNENNKDYHDLLRQLKFIEKDNSRYEVIAICSDNDWSMHSIVGYHLDEQVPIISKKELVEFSKVNKNYILLLPFGGNIYKNKVKEFFSIGLTNVISIGNLTAQNRIQHESLNSIDYFNKTDTALILCSIAKTGNYSVSATFTQKDINFLGFSHDSSRFNDHLKKYGKVKIITGVREPIIRDISGMYQGLTAPFQSRMLSVIKSKFDSREEFFSDFDNINWLLKETHVKDSINKTSINDFMDKFKNNIIDLSKYPFDKEKGYSIVKEGNIEVFVYQLEKLNDIAIEMSDWIGQTNFDKWVNANEASSKWIADSYNQAKKEIKFSQEYFDSCYNDPWIKHFYSEEDIEKFKARWRSNIRKNEISIIENINKDKLSVFIWSEKPKDSNNLLRQLKFIENDNSKYEVVAVCSNNEWLFNSTTGFHLKEKVPIISLEELLKISKVNNNYLLILPFGNINKNKLKPFKSLAINNVISYKMLGAQNNTPHESLNSIDYFNKSNEALILCSMAKTGNVTISATFVKNSISSLGFSHSPKQFNDYFNKYNKIKIITGIREPIIRDLSGMYQGLSSQTLSYYKKKAIDKFNSREEFFSDFENINWLFNTIKNNAENTKAENFMCEFEENILDLSKYPFDKEKGYSIIKEGNIEVFVYQLEKLNDLVKEMSDWIGQTSFDKWDNANEASSKWIAESYNQAKKEIRFSQEYFDKCYNDPYIQHFYSQEDIERFKTRWRPHIRKEE